MNKNYKYYNPNLLKFSAGLVCLFAFFLAFFDLSYIDESLHYIYMTGRLITGTLNLIILLQLCIKKYYSFQLPVIVISLCFNSIYGQFFLPCYYLGFMQCLMGFGLFFPVSKKMYYLISIPLTVMMIITIFISPAKYTEIASQHEKFQFDSAMGVIIVFILSSLGHNYLTLQRMIKDSLYSRFLDIGISSSSMIHDVKGLLSTPLTYTHLLSQRTPELNDNEIFVKLKNDLQHIRNYVITSNSLSLGDINNSELFTLKEIKESLNHLFIKDNISVVSHENDNINIAFNKNSIKSIIFNLCLNSIESSERRTCSIKLFYDKRNNCIVLNDDGPGFSESFLKNWKRSIPFTSKDSGSGLGLFVAKHSLKSLGGNLKLTNNNGALVKIILP